MKICWDNLEGMRLSRNGAFIRKKNKYQSTYHYHDSCMVCDEPFLGAESHKCCSKKCASTGINSGTYAGERTYKRGYSWLLAGERGRVREHVLIAERILGRRLEKGECVHHINMNKLDNSNINLIICNRSYHRWLHHRMSQAWAEQNLN
jgi:hypothetical protein